MILAAFVISAATLVGGTWAPQGGSDFEIRFSENLDFEIMMIDGEDPIKCKTTWPISQPQASALCSDGSKHVLYFDVQKGVVIFNKTALVQTPDKKK